MRHFYASTRFAQLSPAFARVLLFTFALALGWCLWTVRTREVMPSERDPDAAAETPAAEGDAAFYQEVVAAVRRGDNYYDAVAKGLRARKYEPYSMFNWRPPFYAWINGKLPGARTGQIILGSGAIAALLLTYPILLREGGLPRALTGVFVMSGAFLWCGNEGAALFPELWSGTLIALSLAAYGHDRPRLAVWAGVAALFFRELALPYCVLMLVFRAATVRERCLPSHAPLPNGRGSEKTQARGNGNARSEVLLWLSGLLLWGLFLTVHSVEAARRISPGAVGGASSWICFEGTPFALLTAQMNYFVLPLLSAGTWLMALLLPLALLGLGAWPSRWGLRLALTVFAYVAAFHIAGIRTHNGYWGLMYAPLLPLGLLWAPAALYETFRAAATVRERC